MVRCMGWGVAEQGWRKGPWTPEEDKLLVEYVSSHGEGRWSSVSRCSGLNRSGKSCRLRWVNYLRPGLKRGQITPQEEGIIIELHALWGNKWSTIARYLPGRTDNEIKNYWRTHFKKKKEPSTRRSHTKIKSQKQKAKLQQPQQQPKQSAKPQTEVTNMLPIELPVSTMVTVPNTTMVEQNLVAPTMSWMDAICQDLDGPWCGSLWNSGDPLSVMGRTGVDQAMIQDQHCSKMALLLSVQNQTTLTNNINNINNIFNNDNNITANNNISWAIDPNYLYNNNGGCIF